MIKAEEISITFLKKKIIIQVFCTDNTKLWVAISLSVLPLTSFSSDRFLSFYRGTGLLNLALSNTPGSKLSTQSPKWNSCRQPFNCSLYEPGLFGPKSEACELNSLYKVLPQICALSFISPQGSFNFTRIFSDKWHHTVTCACALPEFLPLLPTLLSSLSLIYY